MSQRRLPVRLRRSPLTREVSVITRYTVRDGVMRASNAHDVHGDFLDVMLDRLIGGLPAVQPLLVKAAKGKPLSDAEREQVGTLADRLGSDIVAHGKLRAERQDATRGEGR